MLSIYIYILAQCNPYHLVDPSSCSKHGIMFTVSAILHSLENNSEYLG